MECKVSDGLVSTDCADFQKTKSPSQLVVNLASYTSCFPSQNSHCPLASQSPLWWWWRWGTCGTSPEPGQHQEPLVSQVCHPLREWRAWLTVSVEPHPFRGDSFCNPVCNPLVLVEFGMAGLIIAPPQRCLCCSPWNL